MSSLGEDKSSNMNSNAFDPKTCPVGIVNEKNIEKLGDHFDMAMDRLTEKISEMKDDVNSLSKNIDKNFTSMDSKFEAVDKRFDSMEDTFETKINHLRDSIPDIVDSRVDRKRGNTALNAVSWVLTCGVGAVLVSVVTSYVKLRLGL